VKSFSVLRAALALVVAAALAGCAAQPTAPTAPTEIPGYGQMEDGGFTIAAVPPQYVPDENHSKNVPYDGDDKPGSIVVDPHVKYLFLVKGDGTADRYRIAVGDEGRGLKSTTYVGRKAEWPSWTPTRNMIRTMPELYADKAGGMKPGPDNPLGARALYLYRGGKDTMFRIHGTGDYTSIGHATSAGCIRLYNQDITDLYNKVDSGATVRIRSVEESRRINGDEAVDRALEADIAFREAFDAALAARRLAALETPVDTLE
jgi:lipoprotein-anchoring transpeptidase ErfK/SrfK